MDKNYLAIDVGGTNLKFGLLDRSGTLLEHDKIATPTNGIVDFCRTVLEIVGRYHEHIRGVAFSVPGKIDVENKVIYFGGSLPFLDELNIADMIHQQYPNLLVGVENDGKAAVLAEYWLGNLQRKDNSAAIILGTGVGGGIIVNGKPLHGSHFQAGELSFMLSAGNNLDIYGSAGSAVQMIMKINKALVNEKLTDGLAAFDAINTSNPVALKIFDDYCANIAKLILNIQSVDDLSDYVIGGGISAQPILVDTINQKYDELVDKIEFGGVKIVKLMLTRPNIQTAKFGNEANLYGALYNLLLQESEQ
ncbi:ROK family protein [Lactobacillus delbrueckii subsp. indicus]|uniref:ROK family protein n=1 Tax=Lactobacillus delbrueckii TaxID=1584 RepID=UPI002222C77F|nr:ROK family protein [Lactobacillus delbrueckii]UYX12585.1 ROK family protein [Lactobacillus delbrueckii]UYY84400.1 ROK family protein [Lactobacillus delbrueckii subsp. indicus]